MRIIQVTIEYEFGEIVYLKTDPEILPRIVVSYSLNPGRLIQYELQLSNHEPSLHYGFEIARELSEIEKSYKNLLE